MLLVGDKIDDPLPTALDSAYADSSAARSVGGPPTELDSAPTDSSAASIAGAPFAPSVLGPFALSTVDVSSAEDCRRYSWCWCVVWGKGTRKRLPVEAGAVQFAVEEACG